MKKGPGYRGTSKNPFSPNNQLRSFSIFLESSFCRKKIVTSPIWAIPTACNFIIIPHNTVEFNSNIQLTVQGM
jgi:hypothetical protein